jgi:hypothetical protein
MEKEKIDRLITFYYRQLNDFKYTAQADEAIGALEVLLAFVGKITPTSILMEEFPHVYSKIKVFKFLGVKENHYKFIKRLTKEYLSDNV